MADGIKIALDLRPWTGEGLRARPESVDWGRPQGELAGAFGPSIVWVGKRENERKCERKPYNHGTRGEVYEVWSHS